MTRVKVKEKHHDCKPPEVPKTETVIGVDQPGFWRRLLGAKARTWTKTEYEFDMAQWSCPDCDTLWEFGYIIRGRWSVRRMAEQKWVWKDI